MTDRQLINQLKNLKQIHPDEGWVVFCRESLLEKMNDSKINQGFDLNLIFSDFTKSIRVQFKKWQDSPYLKPVAVSALVFSLILGGSVFTVLASRDSLPGDALFKVKSANEQIHVIFASDDEKVKIQAEIAEKRVNELGQIVKQSLSAAKKRKKVEKAVVKVQESLAAVRNEMPVMNEKSSPQKAVELAQVVTEKIDKTEKTLKETKENLPLELKNQELAEKLTEASNIAENISTKALEVIIARKAKGEVDVSDEAIKAKLTEKIQKTENKIKTLAILVDKTEIGEINSTSTTSLIKDQSEKATEVLNQAKDNLDNDPSAVFETVKAADAIIKSAEKIAENGTSIVDTGDDEMAVNQEPATADQSQIDIPDNTLQATSTCDILSETNATTTDSAMDLINQTILKFSTR